MTSTVRVVHLTDPGCPWAYSATPALTLLRWRFGDQLDWRLVTIGLREQPADESSGYTPLRTTRRWQTFRDRFGMPFTTAARSRNTASGRACRAIVATRLAHPGREHAVLRALQFAVMTTTLLHDTDEGLRAALAGVEGIDAAAIVAALDAPEVAAAYDDDRALARSAEGSPTEAMGRAASYDGPVRFTAPSLLFELGDRRLDAGGFQPFEVYDACLANLAPELERREPASDAVEALEAFPDGLTTQEVATIMTERLDAVDREAAELALIEAVYEGRATRRQLGDDALWLPSQPARPS